MKPRPGGQRRHCWSFSRGSGGGAPHRTPPASEPSSPGLRGQPGSPFRTKSASAAMSRRSPSRVRMKGSSQDRQLCTAEPSRKPSGQAPPGAGPHPGPPGAGTPARLQVRRTLSPATCSRLRSSISIFAFGPHLGAELTASSGLHLGRPGKTQNSHPQASRQLPTDPAMAHGR